MRRSATIAAALKIFAETAGLGQCLLAWKCSATCFLTKPTIADKYACSRISSDSPCRRKEPMASGIGKNYGETAGHLEAPAMLLKQLPCVRIRKKASEN